MKYRDLGTEAKQRACASSKLRYARRRNELRRANYLRLLPSIKNPRLGTLLQYGLVHSPEGWVTEDGTLVCESLFSPPS